MANPQNKEQLQEFLTRGVADVLPSSTTLATDLRIRGKKVREVIFPFLAMVRSSIERSAYITEIHNKMGLSESAIIEDFELYQKSNPESFKEPKTESNNGIATSRRVSLEKKLFGILFWIEKTDNKEYQGIIDEFKNGWCD